MAEQLRRLIHSFYFDDDFNKDDFLKAQQERAKKEEKQGGDIGEM